MRDAIAAFFGMFRTAFIAGNEFANAAHTVAKATNKLAQVGEIMAESLQDEAQQERAINNEKFKLKLAKAKKTLEAETNTFELEYANTTKTKQ